VSLAVTAGGRSIAEGYEAAMAICGAAPVGVETLLK
jgi:hypothetical protein